MNTADAQRLTVLTVTAIIAGIAATLAVFGFWILVIVGVVTGFTSGWTWTWFAGAAAMFVLHVAGRVYASVVVRGLKADPVAQRAAIQGRALRNARYSRMHPTGVSEDDIERPNA